MDTASSCIPQQENTMNLKPTSRNWWMSLSQYAPICILTLHVKESSITNEYISKCTKFLKFMVRLTSILRNVWKMNVQQYVFISMRK